MPTRHGGVPVLRHDSGDDLGGDDVADAAREEEVTEESSGENVVILCRVAY